MGKIFIIKIPVNDPNPQKFYYDNYTGTLNVYGDKTGTIRGDDELEILKYARETGQLKE